MLTIVAAIAHGRQVFVAPPDRREEARAAKLSLASAAPAAAKSDHIAIVAAFNAWNEAWQAGGRHEASKVPVAFYLPYNVHQYLQRSMGKHASLALTGGSYRLHASLYGRLYTCWALEDLRATGFLVFIGGLSWKQVSRRFFLSEPAMEAILAGRDDYAAALRDLGFSDDGFREALRASSSTHTLDEYSNNARIVKAAICAGAALKTCI